MELAGRHALITGGASGIGAAVARELAGLGARITIADLDVEVMAAVADELGAQTWTVDLSELQPLDDLRLDVDILVNNAGIQHVSPIEEFEPATFSRIIAIMLEAPFRLIRACLPRMYARGWGRVINISSVHGLRASEFKSAYVAAKHGLEGLSKVTALEGGPHGVTSNCVNPGYVRTPLVQAQIADQARIHGLDEQRVVEEVMLAHSAIKRLVEPAEVADLVGFLAGDRAAMITGASYTMDGGWCAQ